MNFNYLRALCALSRADAVLASRIFNKTPARIYSAPLKKGRAATMTHDYKRNGTTTLFAALNVLVGTVIAQCQQRHRHDKWLKFLKKVDRKTPKDKTPHLIADNNATHKHPKVQEWPLHS